MSFREIIAMAFGSLGGHKLRSGLTMAGITIGVFSVIGVMTAVSALRGSIETGLSFLGANTFQFGKYPSGVQALGNNRAAYMKRPNITLAEAERYQKLMEGVSRVISLSATYQGSSSQASYGGRTTTPTIRYCGGNEWFLETNQFEIETGRNLAPEDEALRRPVVIIGQTVRSELFPAESPLGRVITVRGHAYTVIGTFAAKGTAFGGSQDDIAMVPLTRLIEDNGPRYISINLATEAPSQADYEPTLEQGITAMRIVRQLRPGQDNDFESYSNDALLAAFARIADTVSDGALIVSAIALVASGVGIMNIMLVSVTERTREIGVRKSIGAHRSSILAQFLVEAVALALIGGLAGILLGIAAGDALALLLHASVVFPWGWAVTGVLVCSAIGMAFGLYPALRAAALDPVDALRYE